MTNKNKEELICECEYCKYKWTPRKQTIPKSCPNCKNYNWNGDRNKREKETE